SCTAAACARGIERRRAIAAESWRTSGSERWRKTAAAASGPSVVSRIAAFSTPTMPSALDRRRALAQPLPHQLRGALRVLLGERQAPLAGPRREPEHERPRHVEEPGSRQADGQEAHEQRRKPGVERGEHALAGGRRLALEGHARDLDPVAA